MQLTAWKGVTTVTNGQTHEYTWAGLAADLEKLSREVVPKAEQVYFIQGVSPSGDRNNASVSECTILAFDADNVGPWDELREYLELTGLAYILYESSGHGEGGAIKWRCLIPLAKPFPIGGEAGAHAWRHLYGHLAAHFGSEAGLTGRGFDLSLSRVSQPVYVGCRRTEKAPPRRVVWGEGRSFDLEAYAATVPAPPAFTPRGIPTDARPTLAFLFEAAGTLGEEHDGKIYVRCPWDDEHSAPLGDSEPTSASVILPPTEGHTLGTFKCLHASCDGRWSREQIASRLGEDVSAKALELEHAATRFPVQGNERQTPYTEEEVEAFARELGVSKRQYLDSLLVIDGRSSTTWVRDGLTFRRPIVKQHAEKALDQFLWRYPFPRTDSDGKKYQAALLVKWHSSLANDVRASFAAERSYYDPRQARFVERLAPERTVAPRFDEQIDRWLRLLGGKSTERLLDWLACATKLEAQSAALYLCGEPGAGKGMLAAGLARIWTEGKPCSLDHVMGSFQDELATCPLVFADETINDRDSSAKLRSLIGTSSISLNRKHLSSVPIEGAIRVIVAGNNDGILSFDEILTDKDIDALAVRFLKVDVGPEARDYLESIGGLEVTTRWVAGDGIAAHVHWLVTNREVTRGKRFIVDGNTEEVASMIKKHSTLENQILGVVTDGLMGEAFLSPVLVDKDYCIWVHPKRVYQALREIYPNLKASERQVCDAVSNVCLGSNADRRRKKFVADPEAVLCRELDRAMLEDWAGRVRGLDTEALTDLIIKRSDQKSEEDQISKKDLSS